MVSVAQLVNHAAGNTKIKNSIPREHAKLYVPLKSTASRFG